MMDSRETKRTVPIPSVGADGEQPNSQKPTMSIAEEPAENKSQDERMEDILRELQRTSDPAYLHTVSMNELYQNVYQSRPPIIDGLLYPGTYLFAGAPKVGKSFLVAQLAYHVSTGQKLWEYDVRPGTVLEPVFTVSNAVWTGLFPPYCVAFSCNTQSIPAKTRLVWRKNPSPIRHIRL